MGMNTLASPSARSRSRRTQMGCDPRGSSKDRRARKLWMLSPAAGAVIAGAWRLFGGDGASVPCIHGCGRTLTYETVEADRIVPGGSYRRSNVQPACGPCNRARSNNVDWVLAV